MLIALRMHKRQTVLFRNPMFFLLDLGLCHNGYMDRFMPPDHLACAGPCHLDIHARWHFFGRLRNLYSVNQTDYSHSESHLKSLIYIFIEHFFNTEMKRRIFLKRTALASCMGMVPVQLLTGSPITPHLLAHPELLQLLDDPDAVAAIGDAYLSSSPTPDDITTLSSKLKRRLGSIRTQSLPDAIASCVKHDFAAGHTRQLNGWILAETEAMQCALFSLTRA